MYRPAIAGTEKIVIANRLIDGVVIFVGPGPSWVTDILDAAVFEDGPALDQALEFGAAEIEARRILDPYAVDVTIEDGRPVPMRLREQIRVVGPSVDYGEEERRWLDRDPDLAAAE